jgi:transketolase N-terminal domain/subunit
MHGNTLPRSVVAAALDACAHESERLNSERIAKRFGSYGIEVLSSEPGLRRSNLYSSEDGMMTCRTYAVVRFVDEPDTVIDAEHAKILAGQSIGAIFKASGWTIVKETLHIGAASLDDAAHPVATLMRLDRSAEVAMHVYRLLLQKGRRAIDYATLIEMHHPDYLGRADLMRLFSIDARSSLRPQQVEEMKTLGLSAA